MELGVLYLWKILKKRIDTAIEELNRQVQFISDMDIAEKFPKESIMRFDADFTSKEQDIYMAGVSDGVRVTVSLMLTRLDIGKIQEAFNNGSDGGREDS